MECVQRNCPNSADCPNYQLDELTYLNCTDSGYREHRSQWDVNGAVAAAMFPCQSAFSSFTSHVISLHQVPLPSVAVTHGAILIDIAQVVACDARFTHGARLYSYNHLDVLGGQSTQCSLQRSDSRASGIPFPLVEFMYSHSTVTFLFQGILSNLLSPNCHSDFVPCFGLVKFSIFLFSLATTSYFSYFVSWQVGRVVCSLCTRLLCWSIPLHRY